MFLSTIAKLVFMTISLMKKRKITRNIVVFAINNFDGRYVYDQDIVSLSKFYNAKSFRGFDFFVVVVSNTFNYPPPQFPLLIWFVIDCRICKKSVCGDCSKHKEVVPEFGESPVRVCSKCAGKNVDLLAMYSSSVDHRKKSHDVE